MAIIFPFLASKAATYNTKDAKIMDTIAKDMCARPSEYGFTVTETGDLTGKVNTGQLFRKFGKAGLTIKTNITTSKYSGVPAKDLASALANTNSCVQNVFRELTRSYRIESLPRTKTPIASRQTQDGRRPPVSPPSLEPTATLWTSPLPQISSANRQQAPKLLAEGNAAESARLFSEAQRLRKLACEYGEGEACRLLATSMEEGRGSAPDLLAAYSFYDRGCQLGDALACYGAGFAIEKDRVQIPLPGVRLRAYYKRACDMGNSLYNSAGCNALGLVAAKGIKGPSDIIAARLAFEKSCLIGFSIGCHSLATFMRFGLGGLQDISKARQLEEQACKTGYKEACDALPSFPKE